MSSQRIVLFLNGTSPKYKRKGYSIATDEQLKRMAKVPKRELMRRGINQHTLEKICKRTPVRAAQLGKCLTVLSGIKAVWSKAGLL